MKAIVICFGNIRYFPPALSVCHCLKSMNYNVVVLTDNMEKDDYKDILADKVVIAGVNYYKKRNLLSKLIMYYILNKKIKKFLREEYIEEKTHVWFIGNETMKYLNKSILSKNYILHFLELTSDIKLTQKIPFLKINIKEYCNKAKNIVVCEENRAYITMLKWNLDKLPLILPNKLFLNKNYNKNTYITNDLARSIIHKRDDYEKNTLFSYKN